MAVRASVIIPTFRRPDTLSDTLASVLEQDYPPAAFEILIVDNAPDPTDEVRRLCDAATGSVRTSYLHEGRTGLHFARHAGADCATGEVLVYIDDDVLCPQGWLRAMVAPYEDRRVGMVAAKVVLRYEGTPPTWLREFRGILSALDWGDRPGPAALGWTPVGCNMSVRRSVLYELGGFHPDGFGDRGLVHLRGDGECGLARKLHRQGWVIWYAPEAWLEHRIGARRMEWDYIRWRSKLAGIEAAYSALRYRYRNLTILRLLVQSIRAAALVFFHSSVAVFRGRGGVRGRRHRAAAVSYAARSLQHLRQMLSPSLRAYTLREEYRMTGEAPPPITTRLRQRPLPQRRS